MLNPGIYWIGDLRYILDDDNWDSVKAVLEGNDFGEHLLPSGIKYAIYGTVFGEGVFCDNFDREYYTSSGTIGCISVGDSIVSPTLGNILKFKFPFQTGYLDDTECIIFFGDVEINTAIVEN
jgi:hypothetical protein